MGHFSDSARYYVDPLTYLPRKPVQEFAKKRIIYDQYRPPESLYLVTLGRVKITTTAEDGVETIGRIVCTEGLFGEPSLIGAQGRRESAVVLDNATLMSWTRTEIEQHIEREPRLGVALIQYMIRHGIELQDRIENMSSYKTPERVVLSLTQLAATLGMANEDGSTRIAS